MPIDIKHASEEAIEYLMGVVRSSPTGRQMHVGVSAAKSVLEHARQSVDPLEQLVLLLGDEEAVLLWCQEVVPKLQMRVAARKAAASWRPALTEGGSDDDDT